MMRTGAEVWSGELRLESLLAGSGGAAANHLMSIEAKRKYALRLVAMALLRTAAALQLLLTFCSTVEEASAERKRQGAERYFLPHVSRSTTKQHQSLTTPWTRRSNRPGSNLTLQRETSD